MGNNKYIYDFVPREVVIGKESKTIMNVREFELVGCGIDGIVLRLDEKRVIKILKDSTELQKKNNKMTYEKLIKFINNLDLNRIVQPRDIIYNIDGNYVGYVMDYIEDITLDKNKEIPIYKKIGDFTCGELVDSFNDLEVDFARLNEQHVQAKDINDGSYLFSCDFMHICDMDRYLLSSRPQDINRAKLNYVIARFLYLEMKKCKDLTKEECKILNDWVKKMSNSYTFKRELEQEIGINYREKISDYAEEKAKYIIKHR